MAVTGLSATGEENLGVLAANQSESAGTSAVSSVTISGAAVPVSPVGESGDVQPVSSGSPRSVVLERMGLSVEEPTPDRTAASVDGGVVHVQTGEMRNSPATNRSGEGSVVFSDRPTTPVQEAPVAPSPPSADQTYTSTTPVIPRSRKLEELGIDLSPYARITDRDEAQPQPVIPEASSSNPPIPQEAFVPRISGAELAPEAARQPAEAAPEAAPMVSEQPVPPSPRYAAPAPPAEELTPAFAAAGTPEREPGPPAQAPVAEPDSFEPIPVPPAESFAPPVELPRSEPASPAMATAAPELPQEQDESRKGGLGGLFSRFKRGRDREPEMAPVVGTNPGSGMVPQPGVMAEPGEVTMQGGAFAAASPAGPEPSAPATAEEPGETIAEVGTMASDQFSATRDLETQADGYQRFPVIELPDLPKSTKESNIDWMIDQIASAYAVRVEDLNSLDVSLDLAELPSVPADFDAPWTSRISSPVWSQSPSVEKGIDGIFASALQNSNQIAALSQMPLIRETGIQEAEGAFDFNAFIDGRYAHTDEPTGSLLDTGRRGRFEQDLWQGEYGLKKRLKTGAEVSVSNRLSTLDNNSEFLDPNPQAGSEIVVSVTQPLLQGNGYHYNTMALKVAKLDAKMGVAEFVRQLEAYLLELSRTYWGVYLARASYLQKRTLMEQTEKVVKQLEDRAEVDEEATRSELLRARSALAQRKASLIRSEMAIRTAEQRLRALVNDPNYQLGSTSEIIPVSVPIVTPPNEDVRKSAELAIANRPELLEGIYQVQAAGLRRDLQKNELLPSLDLILEGTVAGIDDGREVDHAFSDQFHHGEGWLAGFQFEMPLERNFAKARHARRRQELQMQINQLRSTLDSVLLEAVVAYQDLKTSYRDMQGKYQAVLASREELNELEERLNVDAGEEGKSVGYQLQLILDALERNEAAEQDFLVSVVVYNTAFTELDRARGTLLRRHSVDFERVEGEDGVTVIRGATGPVSGK